MKYLVLCICLVLGQLTYSQKRIVPYTVLEGDWIYKILRSFNKETKQRIIDQILELNPQIENADLIYPGQTLLVPLEFQRAVIRDRESRGVKTPKAQLPPPEPKQIIVEKRVEVPSPPKVIVKEKVEYVYLEKVKKEHYFTFSPIYSYSRLDYNSANFGATAVSKVNWGSFLEYSEKTGQHWTNYSIELTKFKYNDKSTGLDNRDFFNFSFAFEKAWRKGMLELAPGVSFGQYHYLRDNTTNNRLDFFKDSQGGASFRIGLIYKGDNKTINFGYKGTYLLSANGESIEVEDSFMHEAYMRVAVKLGSRWLLDFTPSYRFQQTDTSESEHKFQHLSFRFGLTYQIDILEDN